MPTTRRHLLPIVFRPTGQPPVVPDSRFPRAVAGEQYERYASAIWAQAERWSQENLPRVSADGVTMNEARDVLWAVATAELGRQLHAQEERLLSELVQKQWIHDGRPIARTTPEIPSFLVA